MCALKDYQECSVESTLERGPVNSQFPAHQSKKNGFEFVHEA